jgi:hypothetical protein
MKKRNKLILEFTEFNVMRMNQDTAVNPISGVDNPSLSINAFDKHQDAIRQSMSRINDIMHGLKGTTAYKSLRSKLALENQDIKDITIQRIVKSNVDYDIYLKLRIGEEEYWGIIEDITGLNTTFTSELFKDFDLYQPKEWIIKTKGLVIKTIKTWLKPKPGTYRLQNDDVNCYSVETGKQLKMSKGIEVELIRSHENKIIIRYDNDVYNLVGDNYIYFNWWFEKVEE